VAQTANTLVQLLGRPQVERNGHLVEPPRGRKTWGLLAYLTLADQPPSRRRIASMLCGDADDPLRALRWCLSEMRRLIGWSGEQVAGDPLVIKIPSNCYVDARRLLEGEVPEAPAGELLEGIDFPGLAAFDHWLTSERRYLAARGQALLRDRALAHLAAGRFDWAAEVARRAVDQDPLESRNQEVLVRCLAAAGRADEARRQVARCADLFRRELDAAVPSTVREAALAPEPLDRRVQSVAVSAEIRAAIDAGSAAMAAGAVDSGLRRLRQAVALATGGEDRALEAKAMVALGQAICHSLMARDSEVTSLLHGGLAAAEQTGDQALAGMACYELGFIAVQCGDARHGADWLDRAQRLAGDDHDLNAAVWGTRGMMLSDAALYADAVEALNASIDHANSVGKRRQAAWSLSLVGRVHLLRGEIETAGAVLDDAAEIVRAERWIAFLPWCEALRAEAFRRQGDAEACLSLAEHAFALASDLGDACWMTMAARTLALVHFDRGRSDEAVEWVRRGLELTLPYQWVRGFALDAACLVLRPVNPAAARRRAEELALIAARGGMRDLSARAALHQALLGDSDAADAARLLSADIDSPDLADIVAASFH
jgi:DNA-binding SARP family transcriptional activator